ncbi:hypothetical protein ACFLU5_10345 [Bacteroidota bacterium]
MSDPDKKVMVTPALMIGLTPNSLKKSRFELTEVGEHYDNATGLTRAAPASGMVVRFLTACLRFISVLIYVENNFLIQYYKIELKKLIST